MSKICRRKPYLRHAAVGAIGHSGGKERQLLGTNLDPVPTGKVFVRNVFVLFFFVCVFNSMESLFFDSPAETDGALGSS